MDDTFESIDDADEATDRMPPESAAPEEGVRSGSRRRRRGRQRRRRDADSVSRESRDETIADDELPVDAEPETRELRHVEPDERDQDDAGERPSESRRRRRRRGSERVAMHRVAMHRVAMHRVATHRVATHRVATHRVTMHRVAMHRVAMHRVAVKSMLRPIAKRQNGLTRAVDRRVYPRTSWPMHCPN